MVMASLRPDQYVTKVVNDVVSADVEMSCIYKLCMDTTEVTRSAYALNNGLPPPTDPLLPVTKVNYYEAKAYCEKMGKHMPSGAEYELFAGSGAFATADGNLTDSNGKKEANFNSSGPMNVCSFQRNSLGMCDMTGNVWEWVSDGHDLRDGNVFNVFKELRGGSWCDDFTGVLRVGFRNVRKSDVRDNDAGFRCVMGDVLSTQRRKDVADDIIMSGKNAIENIVQIIYKSPYHYHYDPAEEAENERIRQEREYSEYSKQLIIDVMNSGSAY